MFWVIVFIVAVVVLTLAQMIFISSKLKNLEGEELKKALAEVEMLTHLQHGGCPNFKIGTMDKLTEQDLQEFRESSDIGGYRQDVTSKTTKD